MAIARTLAPGLAGWHGDRVLPVPAFVRAARHGRWRRETDDHGRCVCRPLAGHADLLYYLPVRWRDGGSDDPLAGQLARLPAQYAPAAMADDRARRRRTAGTHAARQPCQRGQYAVWPGDRAGHAGGANP